MRRPALATRPSVDSTTIIEPPLPVVEFAGSEVAGRNSGLEWHQAGTAIEGNTVVVSSPEVQQPVAVRYLDAMNTDHGTLYNKEGLPASPFTTENWQRLKACVNSLTSRAARQ